MKKIVLFFAAAMIAVSCSDDDSSSTQRVTIDPTDLIGKWQFSRTWVNGQEYDLNCEAETTYEYKNEGVLTIDEHYGTVGDCDNDVSNQSYNYDDGVIIISNLHGGYDGGPYKVKYQILSYSEDKLKVEAIYETDEVVPGNGPYEDQPYEGDIPQQYRWVNEYNRIQ